MEVPMLQRSNKAYYFLTILFLLFHLRQVLSQYHYFDTICDDSMGTYTDKKAYESHMNVLLPKLTNQASLDPFNNYTVVNGTDKSYGLYLCRGDLNHQQCHDCVESATLSISEKCPVSKAAIVWYQECMVRYSNQSIFSFEDESYLDYTWSTANVSNPDKFNEIFGKTVDSVITQASYADSLMRYATAEANFTLFETVYIMGICTPDIVGSLCERCLRVALSSMAGCCGTARANLAMYLPSCWLRYDSAPFVLDSVALAPRSPALLPPTPHRPSPSPPKGASTRTTLSPIWICFALWLLMVVGIPNNIMAL